MGVTSGGGDFVLPIMTSQGDLWKAIATSPAILDTIIAKEKLDIRYKKDNIFDTRKYFLKRIKTNVTSEGILEISIEDKDPAFSAHLTNLLVDELDKFNRAIKSNVSSETRIFLEERLSEAKEVLTTFEDSLVLFQSQYGVVSIGDQARIALENAAQVKGQLLITEIELGIANMSFNQGHSKLSSLQARKSQYEKLLSSLEKGTKKSPSGSALDLPLSDVPGIGLSYTRLLRETTTRQIVYEYLIQQFEQASIDEKRDTPALRVLSKAIPPYKKDRPKRSIIAVVSAFSIFFMTCIYLILINRLNSIKHSDPETWEKITALKKSVSTGKNG